VGSDRSWGVRAQVLRQELDLCEFSYGLAAGGRDVDWLGRHRERVSRRWFAADRDSELARIARIAAAGPDTPDGWSQEFRLPSHWVHSV
jgi:hypothetical protein